MPDAVRIGVFDYHPLLKILRQPQKVHRLERWLRMPRLLLLLETPLLFLR